MTIDQVFNWLLGIKSAPDWVSVTLWLASTPFVKVADVVRPAEPARFDDTVTVLPAPVNDGTVLLFASCAVIRMLNAAPAVAVAGALTRNREVAAALTTMLLLVPVMEPTLASVAVTVRLPKVLNVTPLLNVCDPASPAVKT